MSLLDELPLNHVAALTGIHASKIRALLESHTIVGRRTPSGWVVKPTAVLAHIATTT